MQILTSSLYVQNQLQDDQLKYTSNEEVILLTNNEQKQLNCLVVASVCFVDMEYWCLLQLLRQSITALCLSLSACTRATSRTERPLFVSSLTSPPRDTSHLMVSAGFHHIGTTHDVVIDLTSYFPPFLRMIYDVTINSRHLIFSH